MTLRLDGAASLRFERLRRAHFPPARNLIPAHVTLFHHLPGVELQSIGRTLQAIGDRMSACVVTVAGLRRLGSGVAYALSSEPVSQLHRDLVGQWETWLTRQDRQPFAPHVTIQNKVDPRDARLLHAVLGEHFAPYEVTATGLCLWRYLGGPWEAVETVAFSSRPE